MTRTCVAPQSFVFCSQHYPAEWNAEGVGFPDPYGTQGCPGSHPWQISFD